MQALAAFEDADAATLQAVDLPLTEARAFKVLFEGRFKARKDGKLEVKKDILADFNYWF